MIKIKFEFGVHRDGTSHHNFEDQAKRIHRGPFGLFLWLVCAVKRPWSSPHGLYRLYRLWVYKPTEKREAFYVGVYIVRAR